MNGIENFIAENWFSIATILFAVAGMYWRLKNLEKKVDHLNEKVNDHFKPDNPAPHVHCAVETQKISSVEKSIEDVKGDLSDVKADTKYLTRCMYEFLSKNGHSIPKPPTGQSG